MHFQSKFEVIRKLGEGGFAAAYLCSYIADPNRKVAIKIMNKKKLLSTKSHCQMVWKEVETIFTLNHPLIIRYFDLFQDEEEIYVVMEYMRGGAVSDYIEKYGVLDEKESASVIKQVCESLAYIHS